MEGINRGVLAGRAAGEVRFSHTNHGTEYDTFPLEVKRLSGAADVLNIVVSRELLAGCPVREGTPCRVTGQVRSFNNRSGVGARLVITFFAQTIEPWQGEDENRLELTGVLCKEPVVRRTPLGREIADLLLAVNRRYGRSDYLPCIAWGGAARTCGGLGVGDRLSLLGRFQSRKYNKAEGEREEERTAYEISVISLEPVEGQETRT